MGSPMVFHTAPPQPASKARMICSPQLVGGALASQKGLGQRIPAKFVVRSAMVVSIRKQRRNAQRRALAIRHGVYDLAASVHTVSTGEEPRVRCLTCSAINNYAPILQLHSARLLQQIKQR